MKTTFTVRVASLLLAAMGVIPLSVDAQTPRQGSQRGNHGSSPAQNRQPSPIRRQNSPGNRQNTAPNMTHARRDIVRTNSRPQPPKRVNNFPPIPRRFNTPTQSPHIPVVQVTPIRQSQRTFTRTPLGRRYDNGTSLRRSMVINQRSQHPYFPSGHAYYPFYSSQYDAQTDFISPYGHYYGVCAPYILSSHGFFQLPQYSYVETVVYNGSNFDRFYDSNKGNAFDQRDFGQQEPGLLNAISELHEAFRGGDIDSLVALTDPKTEIAIFLTGEYQYSMDSNDFLDLTRDAMAGMRTIQFDLTQLHKRATGVFVVSGKHVYRDPTGHSRTVYVSYVLESLGGQWTLTQVGTAPDRIQDWN